MTRQTFWARLLVTAVTLALVLVLLHRPVLRLVATALVVEDPLQHADAVVVVAGGTPWREAKAAALFHEGWAPRVVISRPFRTSSIRELNALGVRTLDLQGESRMALEKYGVPSPRIVALTALARTTEAELQLVHEAALAGGYRRVILVTSPLHTRRVKLIWSRESRHSHLDGIVEPAYSEDFRIDGWWRTRRIAEDLLHEYLGIMAFVLGISRLMQ